MLFNSYQFHQKDDVLIEKGGVAMTIFNNTISDITVSPVTTQKTISKTINSFPSISTSTYIVMYPCPLEYCEQVYFN